MGKSHRSIRWIQTVDKKLFSPRRGGRIALSANERIAEFLDFAIQAKFAYVNKLEPPVDPVAFVVAACQYVENVDEVNHPAPSAG
ncbi:MAG: hypothetical protein KHW90_09380 [Clostridiales bacterium]|nr:hypothetical protein [Clostridiales bacterium]